MFSIFKRDTPSIGTVFFRGSPPPRAEEFASLDRLGIRAEPAAPAQQDAHWQLRLRHPQWGQADVVCLRNAPPPPAVLIQLATSLSDEEKAEAASGRSGVTVSVPSTQKNVLRDRKNLLRFLRAIMGEDGVVAADHGSELFWSRAMLDDELAHDADLDIEATYCAHAVRADGDEDACAWLHTHGLASLGAFDFDILGPDRSVLSGDVLRSIAFAIAEGSIHPSTPSFQLARPGGEVAFVPVADFHRQAPAREAALRDNDGSHNTDRAVLCDPVRRRLFGLLGGGVRASRFLARPLAEGTVLAYSHAATDLMAERARNTLTVLRDLFGEFEEFQFPTVLKLGYPADGGGHEHLWFQAHGFRNGSVDATLLNRPHAVPSLSEGDRREHSLELLTDWSIMTPVGTINPRSLAPARLIRAHKDKIRFIMSEPPPGED